MWNVGTCRPDAKGETQVGSTHEGESTDAGHRGGPTRSSVEVPVMGVERRGWIIWPNCLANQRWEESEGKATPPGLPERRGDTSRMNREIHVRICEGLGVRFPRATRLAPRSRTRDEGRPLGAGLQEQVPNYLKLLR